MADGRRRDEWDRTSLLAALIYNQWAKRENRRKPAAFHPYEKARGGGDRLTPATIGRLRVFLSANDPQREAS